MEKFGRTDIAINTVGKVLKNPFGETNEEEYDSMSDINSNAVTDGWWGTGQTVFANRGYTTR